MTGKGEVEELGPFSRLSLNRSREEVKERNNTSTEDEEMFAGLFGKLSLTKDDDIPLSALERVISNMKSKAQSSISVETMLSLLQSYQSDSKLNVDYDNLSHNTDSSSSTSNKAESPSDQKAETVILEDVEEEEDDDSISSSVNSSWIDSPPPMFPIHTSPLKHSTAKTEPPSPATFNFKTPKKIFPTQKVAGEDDKNSIPPNETEKKEMSPAIVVDSSPPPNFFDRSVSASTSGSVFGPPDDALLPNKKINEASSVPVARTLFGSEKINVDKKDPLGESSKPICSLFSGSEAPAVTFDIGKSSDKATNRKQKKFSKARGGKVQMNQNLPTTNFQAFSGPKLLQPDNLPPPPFGPDFSSKLSFSSSLPPNPPQEGPHSSPMHMDMEQSPHDNSSNAGLSQSESTVNNMSNHSPVKFSFNMGSGSTTNSKGKGTNKGSQRKGRRANKTSPANVASDPHPPNISSSPIKSSTDTFVSPDDNAETADREEVDSRMIALAELFKKEGKQLYSMERYDMAYDAFSKALKAAPDDWAEIANVLSNRAASLIMMERVIEAISDCEKSSSIDPSFLKVHSRRGRALFKLGRVDDAAVAFQLVLSSPVSAAESFQNSHSETADYGGRKLAHEAMKQVILAKSLISSLDRMQGSQGESLEGTDTNPATKVYMKTADDLLAICPYMRAAQVHKARATAQMHNWVELKEYIELCVLSLHVSMQEIDAHHLARLPLEENIEHQLEWLEDENDPGSVNINVNVVKNMLLVMGPAMAQWYVVALKNQNLCRTSCSSNIMRLLIDILSDLRVSIEGADKMDSLLNDDITANHSSDWNWLLFEVTKISNLLSLKNVADEKFRLGKYADAIRSYCAVLQVDTDAHIWNAIMFGNKAAAAMRLRLFSDAVSDCHQSLARDPKYGRAYLRRARAQRELGHYAASIRDYKKYLKMSPRPADSLDVQMELEEVTNTKIEEELLTAAKKKREAAEAREREWRSKHAEQASESFKQRGKAKSRRNNSRDEKYDSSQRENFSNQQRRQQQQSSYKSSSNRKESASVPLQPEINAENFYARLGVASNADEKVIKVAYRKMALKYHPDKNKDESSTEIFKKLTEAYSTLSDNSARRKYDDSVRLSQPSYSSRSRNYGW